jgi:hypothetical protein
MPTECLRRHFSPWSRPSAAAIVRLRGNASVDPQIQPLKPRRASSRPWSESLFLRGHPRGCISLRPRALRSREQLCNVARPMERCPGHSSIARPVPHSYERRTLSRRRPTMPGCRPGAGRTPRATCGAHLKKPMRSPPARSPLLEDPHPLTGRQGTIQRRPSLTST